MKFLTQLKKWFILLGTISLVIWIFYSQWDFLFKKKVVGEVVAVEKVNPSAITLLPNSSENLNPQVFSYSIGIKNNLNGEIFMASSEDRQWAAVKPGNCVVAVYFPYPPWKILKANTSHNARLLRNFTSCAVMNLENGIWEDIKFFFLMP